MRKGFWDFHLILFKNTKFDIITVSIQESSEIIFFLVVEPCLKVDNLVTIELKVSKLGKITNFNLC